MSEAKNDLTDLLGVEMTYSDIHGREKLLHEMVRDEPEWAASRIRVCEQLEGVEIPELHSKIFKLENEVNSLRRHLRIERDVREQKKKDLRKKLNTLQRIVATYADQADASDSDRAIIRQCVHLWFDGDEREPPTCGENGGW